MTEAEAANMALAITPDQPLQMANTTIPYSHNTLVVHNQGKPSCPGIVRKQTVQSKALANVFDDVREAHEIPGGLPFTKADSGGLTHRHHFLQLILG